MPKFKVGDIVFTRHAAGSGEAEPYRVLSIDEPPFGPCSVVHCYCEAMWEEEPKGRYSLWEEFLCTEEVALELIKDFIYWCKHREVE